MKQVPRGFTLLEILLVVAAIAILAGIVIVAINPAQQLAETRDAQRHSDVEAISSAILQYTIKTGAYPADIPGLAGDDCPDDTENLICQEGEACDGFSLDELVPNYIAALPIDPSQDGSEVTGYAGGLTSSNRVLICAPDTEEADELISVTR